MFLVIPLLADWSKIGEYRQKQLDKNTVRENSGHLDWDYQPSHKVLRIKLCILKSESQYSSEVNNIDGLNWSHSSNGLKDISSYINSLIKLGTNKSQKTVVFHWI